MKKMLSLAAMFAVLASAAPASAALNFSGDAGVRLRDQSFTGDEGGLPLSEANDDIRWQYRIRLNAAADLGNGYFFKALVMNEDNNFAGGWQSVGYGNHETINLAISNFYFGRMLQNCHYMVGRLPLNSFNNPIFDLSLYPTQPLGNPVFNINFDRVYGANYGTNIGDGMLNVTLAVLDNNSGNDTVTDGDGLFNDGYAVVLGYKANVGDVTIEPQFLSVLTNSDIWGQDVVGFPTFPYFGVTPYTFGATVGVPAGDAKLSLSGFYTTCDDETADNLSTMAEGINAAVKPGLSPVVVGGTKVKYNGYLIRVKGEIGNFMAWYDYNHTTDKSKANDIKYTNHFVWAQYKIPVYSSAAGSLTIQPTLRYLAAKSDGQATDYDYSRLRSELWATVTF